MEAALEGGYVNHPDDKGGETNFGISKRSYPTLNIRTLTRDDAMQINHRDGRIIEMHAFLDTALVERALFGNPLAIARTPPEKPLTY